MQPVISLSTLLERTGDMEMVRTVSYSKENRDQHLFLKTAMLEWIKSEDIGAAQGREPARQPGVMDCISCISNKQEETP